MRRRVWVKEHLHIYTDVEGSVTMRTEKYNIAGMTCSACSSRVEKCVAGLNGMNKVSVNLLTNNMKVTYDDEKLSSNTIVKVIEDAGYGAGVADNYETGKGNLVDSSHIQSGSNAKNAAAIQIKDMKYRLIVSVCFLIPLMYISMHHMLFEWFGIPVPSFIKEAFHGDKNVIAYAFSQFLLLLPILYLNRKYFVHGFKNLFRRSPNMDSLIALGATAATIYGCFAIFRMGYGLGYQDMELVALYSKDIYFESAGTILTLITVGKYLETKSKGKTSEAIEKLLDMAPKTAIVLRNGIETELPIGEVVLNDIILIKPGNSIPVDGEIIEGATSIDEAAITGESIPVDKTVGDQAVSATINRAGFIKIRATKVGQDTTINQIIALVEEASSSKAPIAKMADNIAGVFVPIVIGIAILAAIVWIFNGASFEFALSIGISVLVISCPCALGLATPVAIMVGTGKGAENGILIKSGEALEIAHSIDTVVLDKTGTITEGKPVVTDVMSFSLSEQDFLKIAVACEQQSEHPLATAIVQYGKSKQLSEIQECKEFTAIFGKGVTGIIGDKEYYAGNEVMLQELGIDTNAVRDKIDALADEGKTPLLFADKHNLLGIIAVADVEKASSKQAIELFTEMGINVVMLTGDLERCAIAIQKRLGIGEIIAQVLPEDKEKKIAEIQANGHKVAMIGDGINDAPALARADVGIAIGAGTDVAIESADIVLMKSDLLDAVTAVRLSKAVIRNIKENLFWAFFYNSVGIPLAAGVFYPLFGWKLNPMFGAAAMSLSSVCVVMNALRLRFFRTNISEKRKLKNGANNKMDYRRKEEANMSETKVVVTIEGMMCDHCKSHVNTALNELDGVQAEVNLEEKKAVLNLTQEVPDAAIKEAVEKAGYQVTAIER